MYSEARSPRERRASQRAQEVRFLAQLDVQRLYSLSTKGKPGPVLCLKESRNEPLLERISINPQICLGKPCIKGTRIWVSLILDQLASGTAEPPSDELLADYSQLTREDVLAAIAYGAEVAPERIITVPTVQAA